MLVSASDELKRLRTYKTTSESYSVSHPRRRTLLDLVYQVGLQEVVGNRRNLCPVGIYLGMYMN
jgi:hypothetical protein